jgi:3-oxoacyl-[acyl-carrier protein] reductase
MTGAFHFCRAAIPHMRERRYGRIVNIASIAGKEGKPNMAGYSATKAAVIGFTKSLAKEVATEGICVNAVAPAVVMTPILEQLSREQVEYMTARIPMRRTGKPEEIAAVVHFLASPDCSFVTGQCYDASGGRATY